MCPQAGLKSGFRTRRADAYPSAVSFRPKEVPRCRPGRRSSPSVSEPSSSARPWPARVPRRARATTRRRPGTCCRRVRPAASPSPRTRPTRSGCTKVSRRLRDRVTDADLPRYFKRETLGLGSLKAVKVERPRRGVTITRDRWGVPHVKGATQADVAFGAGWATAADRQLIIELLRGPGRIAALDAPGDQRLRPCALRPGVRPERAGGGVPRPPVPAARRAGPEGAAGAEDHRRLRRRHQRAVRKGRAAAGEMDAQRRRRGRGADGCRVRRRWRRRGAALAVPRAAAAEARSGQRAPGVGGPAPARRPGGARRGDRPVRLRRPADKRVRATSSSTRELAADGTHDATTTRLPMSNALLIGAKRSATGKPLFVAGPQVGHYYPGILMELDLDGGGYKARGASFPGLSFAVLLGRGIDYAWSATSAGSDLIDEYVETLCGGSDVEVPVPRRVPRHDDVRRGRDQGPTRPGRPATRVPRDRARPGRRLRDRGGDARRDHPQEVDPRS